MSRNEGLLIARKTKIWRENGIKTTEELTRKGMGLGMMLLLILRINLMLIIKYQNMISKYHMYLLRISKKKIEFPSCTVIFIFKALRISLYFVLFLVTCWWRHRVSVFLMITTVRIMWLYKQLDLYYETRCTHVECIWKGQERIHNSGHSW